MAHNAYMNTYRAYKAGTTKITIWLVDTALRCKAKVDLGTTATSGIKNAGKGEYRC